MSAPGSNRNKFEGDGRSRRSADTVTFTVDASGWSPDEHRRGSQYQANFNAPFPLANYDLGAAPTGPLDIRMGNPGRLPEPRPSYFLCSGRHHKTPSFAPPPRFLYVAGSGNIKRTPSHTTSQRMTSYPHRYEPVPTPTPHSNPILTINHCLRQCRRSPDGVSGHRMSMEMQRSPSTVNSQHAPRPQSHADPRYPSNGRGY
ncbi:hypothetical protein B0H14DRAFT_2949536 [Mycena olivaceomarginata]|nr:hypothetical protein B0H14DRAFT_2949536 [Mycena olivaceomarginata]